MTDQDILIPNPLADSKQYTRFYCLDIGELEDTELEDEVNFLRPKLWGLPPVHWARERVFLLEEEIKKHQGDTKYRAREQPKKAEGVKL